MNKYDDIINLSHYEIKNHKKMSMESRVAQFAPFSALTGYSESIKETERITKEKIILSEDRKEILNLKLQEIEERLEEKPLIKVLYFIKDKNKAGGDYLEYSGNLKRIDLVDKCLIFNNKKRIYLKDICDINIDLNNNNYFSTYN